ncbi:glycoside hydrolase superfamily [Boletus edulis]|nr:glycoside hydrolase superfamily [Boletus edulis]
MPCRMEQTPHAVIPASAPGVVVLGALFVKTSTISRTPASLQSGSVLCPRIIKGLPPPTSLSRELHNRGMYLMVDVVVNDVMATSTNPDLSTYMFKNETPTVVSAFQDWIQSLVLEHSIDGLRIDAAKHVNMDFWPGFCAAAGVFCIGEVFTTDIDDVAAFQGPDALDSVLNYPMYGAIVNAFTIPGPQNITALTDMIAQSKQKYEDCGLLGNFIENQDNPRWHNISVDPQSLYNAMVFNFMSDGIPIVYYGQEQGFSGSGDPWNREPLWTSGYANTTTYQLMSTMNQFRNFLVNSTNWVNSSMQVLAATNHSIAILKGNVISVLTNIGSPPKDTGIPVYTPFPTETPLIK